MIKKSTIHQYSLGIASLVLILGMMACEKEVFIEPNHAPEISEITISPENPIFGDTVTITVTATDEDQDPMTYTWVEANGMGSFVDTDKATVQWIANFAMPANAIFKVTVSDGELKISGTNAVTVSTADKPEVYYVGSSTCGQCHEAAYNKVMDSGHPYKFNLIKNGKAPAYPDFVEAGRLLPLPEGANSWDDILGVIGGFGWKARYVDKTGNLVGTANSALNTGGGNNQYNFWNGDDNSWAGWVDYDPSDVKEYNYSCFRCHTTGASDYGEWLPGIQGSFVYGGVQCEGCHGAGSKHVAANAALYIDNPKGGEVTELCGKCHYRNSDHSVAAKGGFVKHHEQYDEFIHSKHYATAGQNCSTCHDPHERVIWGGDGIKLDCNSTCHTSVAIAAPHDSFGCENCHMAKVAKSGVQTIAGYQGDVHSHSFAIAADTTWNMFSDDGKTMRYDSEGYVKMALKNVCYGCHADGQGGGGTGTAKTLAEVNDYISSIH